MTAHTNTPLPELTRAQAEELLRRLSGQATRRRRGRHIARLAVALLAVGLVGGTMTWTLASLAGLGDRRTPESGGDNASESPSQPQPYRFEPTVTGEVVEGSAGVDVDVEWASSTYPGEYKCRINLFDAGGQPVGSLDTQFAALIATQGLALGPHRSCGVPESGTVFCDPERLDAPVAFVVSNESIDPIVVRCRRCLGHRSRRSSVCTCARRRI